MRRQEHIPWSANGNKMMQKRKMTGNDMRNAQEVEVRITHCSEGDFTDEQEKQTEYGGCRWK